MKTLTDYTQSKVTKALEKAGAFFAFNQEQCDAKADQSLKYSNLGGGMLCPTDRASSLQLELATISAAGIKQDIKENGIKGIIKRELWNHEAFYTGDMYDTIQSLKGYNIPEEKILEVFKIESQTPEVLNSL